MDRLSLTAIAAQQLALIKHLKEQGILFRCPCSEK
jgi:hypothetical protein